MMNKPVFEHTYAGKHFKIYENGTVNVGDITGDFPKDAEIIINRLPEYKYEKPRYEDVSIRRLDVYKINKIEDDEK